MEREQFKNKVGFLLATLGGAIGIANLISFPPLLSKHGILFAVFYLLFTILIGIPLMSMEIAIGRNTSSNAIGAYSKLGGKKWKYLGILNIACCFVLFTIFMILLIWTFRYFTGFAINNIPTDFESYVSKDYKEIVILGGLLISLNVLVVGLGVQKGIERVSKILIPIFAIVLLAFAFWNFSDINSVVLNFKSVFTRFPTNISELGKLLSDALGQAFFSLSLGAGAMLTYGSYLSKKERIGNLANIIVQTDTIVAVICSLFILPLALNLKFSDTPLFIFVTISDYFNSLPYSNLIGSLFFLCLSFVVLTMTISVLEPVVSFLFDKHKKRRFLLALCVGSISLLCLIPLALSFGEEESLTNLIPNGTTKGELGEIIPKYKSLFDLVFDIFINILLPIGGLLTCIFVIRIWKYRNFENEMDLGNGKKWVAKYLKLSTLFIAPLLISILLIIKLTQFFSL